MAPPLWGTIFHFICDWCTNLQRAGSTTPLLTSASSAQQLPKWGQHGDFPTGKIKNQPMITPLEVLPPQAHGPLLVS